MAIARTLAAKTVLLRTGANTTAAGTTTTTSSTSVTAKNTSGSGPGQQKSAFHTGRTAQFGLGPRGNGCGTMPHVARSLHSPSTMNKVGLASSAFLWEHPGRRAFTVGPSNGFMASTLLRIQEEANGSGTKPKKEISPESQAFLKDLEKWTESKLEKGGEETVARKVGSENDAPLPEGVNFFEDAEALSIYQDGLDKYKLGDFEGAMELFTSAAQKDVCALGVFAIGSCYSRLGDHEHAVRFFKRALEYDPINEPALLNLAATLKEHLDDEVQGNRYFQILEAARVLANIKFDGKSELEEIISEAKGKENLQQVEGKDTKA